ncbi:hypothetical protein GCM10023196_085570 [Actinoallomurus vinaceus]|uniref:Peptidase S1 domain-containing protein n=1 Tax=Actinoallomurus vinaceus TaxID=1080074 RepID=A0ABP8UNZ1_9ACTN
MPRRLRSIGALLATTALSLTVATGTAHAGSPADAVIGGTGKASPSAADGADYWTPERMAAATPAADPTDTSTTPSSPPSSGISQSSPGSLPAGSAAAPGTVTPQALTYFWQSKVWASHGVMPATTIGKLYFTDTSGEGHWCTATTIASNNRSTIWTAGHCVTDGKKHWYSKFLFAPDYHDAEWPYGTWSGKAWAAPNGYYDGGDSMYDMAAIALYNNNSGSKVGDVVGQQGYQFSDSNSGRLWPDVRSFGYPQDTHPARSDIDPNAHDLRFCVGEVTTPAYQEISCDMGHGASGGPSLYDLQLSRGWGYIIGLNSFQNSMASHINFGPVLGTAAVNALNAVKSQ